MLKTIKNNKGSIVVGFMAVLFTLSVSSAYFSLARTSAKAMNYDYDLLMTTELSISANERTERYSSVLQNSFSDQVSFAPKIVSIDDENSYFERKYKLEGRAERVGVINTIETGSIKATSEVTVVSDGYEAGEFLYKDSENKPMANAASTLKRVTYAGYFWLTNDDDSENSEGGDDPVWWWGDDLVEGRCHTNTHFSIKNVASHQAANNDGWPLFLDQVTQVEEGINWASSPGPMEDIFQGQPIGFADEQPEVEFLDTAILARTNGEHIHSGLDDNDVIMMDFDGVGQTFLGVVSLTPVEVPVYACYPWPGNNFDSRTAYIDTIPDPPELHFDMNFDPEIHMIVEDTINFHRIEGGVGPIIGYNQFMAADTLWQAGSNHGPNTYFVDQELWVKGRVRGRYTLASAKDIFVVDDIWYDETPISDDDYPDPVLNENDMLGMISEQKIQIRYGYIHPETANTDQPERLTPNSDDVVIYSAICALGQGDGPNDSKHQGIFTFDYQDPQPSTYYWHEWYPNTDSAFVEDYPSDLHLFTYPQTNLLPWPSVPDYDPAELFVGLPNEVRQAMFDILGNLVAGGPGQHVPFYPVPYGGRNPAPIDYPWRNPLWPQIPAGGSEPNDYERGKIVVWGGIHCYRRGFVHRSGTDPNNHPNDGSWDLEQHHWGPGSIGNGYDKDYHYDNRFRYLAPDNYPEANLKGGAKLGGFSVYSFQKKN